eukprot:772811-Prorocentrum_minimum.AAC.1
MPLVFFTFSRVLRGAWRLHSTVNSPPELDLNPSRHPLDPPWQPPADPAAGVLQPAGARREPLPIPSRPPPELDLTPSRPPP